MKCNHSDLVKGIKGYKILKCPKCGKVIEKGKQTKGGTFGTGVLNRKSVEYLKNKAIRLLDKESK